MPHDGITYKDGVKVRYYTREYTKYRLWELRMGIIGRWLNDMTNDWWCNSVLQDPGPAYEKVLEDDD
jgi:hypothetical protein